MAGESATVELTPEQQEKYDLIARNLQEILGEEKLRRHLATATKTINVYWGTAPTGRPHVAYLLPMMKIGDMLNAGCRVTVLFADIHAFLDNMKSTWELLAKRTEYYERIIKALLSALNVPLDQLHFVKGSEYQLSNAYTCDLFKLTALVSQRDALKAGAEVVDDPLLSGLLYPLLQALDEQYLKVDCQYGGVDQRKIFILAEEQLPKLKLGKRYHLMNPMIPGLTGSKMSSSDASSKIDVLDAYEILDAKIEGAECRRGATGENGVLAFIINIVLPAARPEPLLIDGQKFSNAQALTEAFESGRLTPEQLKKTLKEFLHRVLGEVRQQFDSDEMRHLIAEAYAMASDIVADHREKKSTDVDIVLNGEQKKLFDLIVSNGTLLDNGYRLKQRLVKGEPVKVIWTITARGKFHLGFLRPLIVLRQLSRIGCCSITVLISGMEAFMDEEKCPWSAMEARVDYLEKMMRKVFELLDISKATITTMMPTQMDEAFALDMYKLTTVITRREASINVNGSMLSQLLCPILNALGEVRNDADLSIGGEDMKATFELTKKALPRIGYSSASHLLVTQLSSIQLNSSNTEKIKMSASNADSHLDLLETSKQVKAKLGRAFCEPGNVDCNVVLEMAEKIVFPLCPGKGLVISRTPDNGGDLLLKDFDNLKTIFQCGQLHPADLKCAVEKSINEIFSPFRQLFLDGDNQKLLTKAFPSVKTGGKKTTK